MPQNPRNERPGSEREWPRYRRGEGYERDAPHGGRYQTGSDWDRYETGREERYLPEWRRRPFGREAGGFEGERSYPGGGYSEEFGFRQDRGGWRGSGYTDYDRLGWGEDERGDEYFGVGTHAGGGYGTAPGSVISGSGSSGAPGYAGQGAWSDRYADWLAESGGGRGTTGGQYGRSIYGEPGYHRDYGQSYASQDFGRSYGPQGYPEPSRTWQRGEWQREADRYASQPSFRGRGPKGYQRSDERLKEMICDQLTDDPRIDASDIDIDVNQQTVKLTGTIADRRMKYAVEELAEECGAKDVDNQLRVQSK